MDTLRPLFTAWALAASCPAAFESVVEREVRFSKASPHKEATGWADTRQSSDCLKLLTVRQEVAFTLILQACPSSRQVPRFVWRVPHRRVALYLDRHWQLIGGTYSSQVRP